MRTKPTNFEAAKNVIQIGEEVTADQIIQRMIDGGRREIPTKKSIAVKFRNEKCFIIRKEGRGPTIFKRIY
ncbi:hypothetical protein CL614_02700 [archaeon]|nr:hypothetical protein [archaeon]|tara:strand:- start:1082 stop:1294 length:213 start_codon:yes stop_codon:yes gene_type:complete